MRESETTKQTQKKLMEEHAQIERDTKQTTKQTYLVKSEEKSKGG